MAAGKMTVTSLDGWKMRVFDGRHSWVSDLGCDLGGDDAGPAPFDLLLASLATCACFITRRYAQTAKIPVESVTVETAGRWVKPEGGGDEIYEVAIRAAYKGNLSDSDLARLKRAAETCPVKQVLGGHGRVVVEVARG